MEKINREVDIKALVSHIVKGDGEDRCRICMTDTSEGQVFLEDTVMLDGERPVTLAELLENITGIAIHEEQLCPRGVCPSCLQSTIAAQQFRNFVLNALKLWNNALDSLSKIQVNSISRVKSICAFLTGENVDIKLVEDFTKQDSKTVLHSLKSRLTRQPKLGLPSVKKPRLHRNGPKCVCPDCDKAFGSPYYLNLHLKNSGQKEACQTCGQVYIRGQEMKAHLEIVHKERWYLCKECPLLFAFEKDIKLHKKQAHRSGVLTCGDCGRSFTRSGSFEAHSQMHAVRTCRRCQAQFTNRGCYREHRARCEPEAKPETKNLSRNRRMNVRDPAVYTCDYCLKTYSSRPQLKNHIQWIHMNIRPFQCQWCGKSFYTSARLTEHTVVHTRERNFACDLCGVKLVTKMAAVYHRRRHTGEKPYECEDCGEKFISASRRLEHAKRRHMKGNRLQCTKCPATFVRGHELKKHFEKSHKMCVSKETDPGFVLS